MKDTEKMQKTMNSLVAVAALNEMSSFFHGN